MDAEPSSRNSLTVPNLLTTIRILLTPLFIIFLIQGRYPLALLVFLLAGITDLADGLVARAWHQKSPLGTLLDPLADKLLISSSFVALSIFRFIPSWLTVVVISRDLALVVGIILLKLTDQPAVIRPSPAGKATAALQMLTVLLVLVGIIWPLNPRFLNAWFWLTGGVSAFSGIQYIYGGLKTVGRAQAGP